METLIFPSLCVDASCIGNPGILEFRGVVLKSGNTTEREVVFERGPFSNGTNNIGEFLAVVLGLAYLQSHNLPWPIYTDSVTALSWVKKRQCKSKLVWDNSNKDLYEIVQKGELWLNTHIWTNPILKWHTHLWGEIPADYQRK